MKYLVTTISKQNKNKIKLKSSLYKLSMDDLILKSINSYVGEVPSISCPHCHEQCVVKTIPAYVKQLEVSGKIFQVSIDDYPRNICQTCGGEFEDLEISTVLDELLEDLILKKIREKEEMSSEMTVSFKELLRLDI